jgi:mRNA interferase MazF
MAGAGGRKLRPVLVLTGPLGTVPEFVVAYISSVIPSALLPTDLLVDPATPEFASSKLKTVSVLRLHKLSTIHSRDAVRAFGQLSPAAFQEVQTRLKLVFGL